MRSGVFRLRSAWFFGRRLVCLMLDGRHRGEGERDGDEWRNLVSFWSSPNSFLAVSKLSSIARRWPSTLTSVAIDVPAGRQRGEVCGIAVDNIDVGSACPVSTDHGLHRQTLQLQDRPVRDKLESGSRGPFAPSPADRPRQSAGSSVPAISAAEPPSGRCLFHDPNQRPELTPSTYPLPVRRCTRSMSPTP